MLASLATLPNRPWVVVEARAARLLRAAYVGAWADALARIRAAIAPFRRTLVASALVRLP
jgi:hypothetical protein